MTIRQQTAASLPAQPFVSWMPAVSAAPARRLGRRRQPLARYHVIAPELFKDAVSRERARADRFGQAFVLLLVEMDKVTQPASWQSATAVLAETFGDTSIVGWVEARKTLGAIVPEIFTPSIPRRSFAESFRGGWMERPWPAAPSGPTSIVRQPSIGAPPAIRAGIPSTTAPRVETDLRTTGPSAFWTSPRA